MNFFNLIVWYYPWRNKQRLSHFRLNLFIMKRIFNMKICYEFNQFQVIIYILVFQVIFFNKWNYLFDISKTVQRLLIINIFILRIQKYFPFGFFILNKISSLQFIFIFYLLFNLFRVQQPIFKQDINLISYIYLITQTFFNSRLLFIIFHYKILNCSPADPEQKIKQEYYKLAKQYHPDINKGNEEKFKQINEAWDVLSDKHKKQQYDSARSYSNNNETSFRNDQEHGQQQNYEEFIRKQGPNGFYQQYTYRSNSDSQQFSKQQMEEMQRQAQEFMNLFQNGQFTQFSSAFRQATKGDPKFNKVHTFMNFAEMAGKLYQERQKQQMENEIKRQQNIQSFTNKEEKLKESLDNIKSGIKGLWDQFTKK